MNQTIAEKIICSHCGQAAYAGETVVASIDLAMATGKLWFRVPGSIKLELNGHLAKQVTAKDLAICIVGRLGSSRANYKSLELSGPSLFCLELLPALGR